MAPNSEKSSCLVQALGSKAVLLARGFHSHFLMINQDILNYLTVAND